MLNWKTIFIFSFLAINLGSFYLKHLAFENKMALHNEKFNEQFKDNQGPIKKEKSRSIAQSAINKQISIRNLKPNKGKEAFKKLNDLRNLKEELKEKKESLIDLIQLKETIVFFIEQILDNLDLDSDCLDQKSFEDMIVLIKDLPQEKREQVSIDDSLFHEFLTSHFTRDDYIKKSCLRILEKRKQESDEEKRKEKEANDLEFEEGLLEDEDSEKGDDDNEEDSEDNEDDEEFELEEINEENDGEEE